MDSSLLFNVCNVVPCHSRYFSTWSDKSTSEFQTNLPETKGERSVVVVQGAVDVVSYYRVPCPLSTYQRIFLDKTLKESSCDVNMFYLHLGEPMNFANRTVLFTFLSDNKIADI